MTTPLTPKIDIQPTRRFAVCNTCALSKDEGAVLVELSFGWESPDERTGNATVVVVCKTCLVLLKEKLHAA